MDPVLEFPSLHSEHDPLWDLPFRGDERPLHWELSVVYLFALFILREAFKRTAVPSTSKNDLGGPSRTYMEDAVQGSD